MHAKKTSMHILLSKFTINPDVVQNHACLHGIEGYVLQLYHVNTSPQCKVGATKPQSYSSDMTRRVYQIISRAHSPAKVGLAH